MQARSPATWPRIAAALLAVVCSTAALAAESGAPGAAPAPVAAAVPSPAPLPVGLRIDYLPNLIYDGECLTFCGSVVNRTNRAVEGTVVCSLSTPNRPKAGSIEEQVAAPPGRETRFQLGWKLVHLDEIVTMTVTLSVAGQADVTERLRVYPASVDLPELTARGDHLVGPDGGRAVLVVRRQVRERKSRWAVAKWAKGVVAGDEFDPSSGLFVGDLLAPVEERSYIARLKQSDALKEFSFVGVGGAGGPTDAGPAILRTLATFSRSGLQRGYDMAVFFLGSDEPRFGTDVDEFRKAVDLMCGLVRQRGCKRVVFVGPVAPEPLARRTTRYREAMRAVAAVIESPVFDPQRAVDSAGWGVGRHPGEDATKAIADEVVRAVKEATGR